MYMLSRQVILYKLKLLYRRSELSVYVFFLGGLLLEPFSYETPHLILRCGDQVFHSYLIVVTHIRSLCFSVEVHHLLTALIYSLI